MKKEFAQSDNKVTISCNKYMTKYLKVLNSKRFTMVVI